MVKPRKTDLELGAKVHEELVNRKKETPGVMGYGDMCEDVEHEIAKSFHDIMSKLRLDLLDDSMRDSPRRIAEMFVHELFYGLNYANFPKCTAIANEMHLDEMVCERNISVKSVCEHHFMPIYGVAHVAYIPKTSILGLSKLNRIVDFFSRRPQVQERLTEQIAYALSCILNTDDIAVVIKAQHFCVKFRGVEDAQSDTVTSKLLGRFKSVPELRGEFMALALSR